MIMESVNQEVMGLLVLTRHLEMRILKSEDVAAQDISIKQLDYELEISMR